MNALPKTLALALVACLSGCHSYVDQRVLVLDAETQEPIRGARVSVGSMSFPYGPIFPPTSSSAITDQQGVAHVRTASGSESQWLTAAPEGYFAESLLGHQYRDRRGALDSTIRARRLADGTLAVNVWAKPEPTVRVTLPTGYRGYVTVWTPTPPPTGPETPTRLFECTADAHGRCELPAASILIVGHSSLDDRALSYEFQFADGTPLLSVQSDWNAEPSGNRLAAWGKVQDDDAEHLRHIFFVGTEAQAVSERTWVQRRSGDGQVYDQPAQTAAHAEWIERTRVGPLPE